MQKSSINNGLFLGIALIISVFVLYLANPRMFFNAKPFVLFTIFLMMIIKSGLEARRTQGGFISFGQAFINMFVAGAIGYFLATVGEYILYNFIDTGLPDLQKEIELEKMEEISKMGYFNESTIENGMDKIEETDYGGLWTILQNLIIIRLILACAICSAIVALIIKKSGKPIMDDLDDTQDNRYIVNK